MKTDVQLKCKSCGYIVKVDKTWAERFYPELMNSSSSLLSFSLKVEHRLSCINCDVKGQYETIREKIEIPASAYAQTQPLRDPPKPKLLKEFKESIQTPKQNTEVKNSRNIQISGKRCAGCGEMIPKARIKANPNTALCIKCKSDSEKANPDNYKRKADEGFGGSREAIKKSRFWTPKKKPIY